MDWLLVSRWSVLGVGEGRSCGGYAYLDEKDVCSRFCERDGHRLTDAPCTTGHESCLALEGKELLDSRHVVNVVVCLLYSE